jgi:hypothetical protein
VLVAYDKASVEFIDRPRRRSGYCVSWRPKERHRPEKESGPTVSQGTAVTTVFGSVHGRADFHPKVLIALLSGLPLTKAGKRQSKAQAK